MEPQSGSNLSLNPVSTPVFLVTTRTAAWLHGTVANTQRCDMFVTFHCQFRVHVHHKTSSKCNSVRKPYVNLSDTAVALASASKYFQMLPAPPPGAIQNALRLCKSILWKHLQWRRCIQDATRFDYQDRQILELRRPLHRSAGDLVPYSHTRGS